MFKEGSEAQSLKFPRRIERKTTHEVIAVCHKRVCSSENKTSMLLRQAAQTGNVLLKTQHHILGV